MFKKDIVAGAKTKLKSSVQRSIRARVCDTYPLLGPFIDEIIPKKEQLDMIKIPDARVTVYALGPTPLFYQYMDDTLIPHLSLVHKYPDHIPRIRVDRGAIRFVLSGAALMVPGVISPGGRLPSGDTSGGFYQQSDSARPVWGNDLSSGNDFRYTQQPDILAGAVVIVEAEGKENACCVGVLKMGTKEMREIRKGIGIEGGHYLGDGLWKLKLD